MRNIIDRTKVCLQHIAQADAFEPSFWSKVANKAVFIRTRVTNQLWRDSEEISSEFSLFRFSIQVERSFSWIYFSVARLRCLKTSFPNVMRFIYLHHVTCAQGNGSVDFVCLAVQFLWWAKCDKILGLIRDHIILLSLLYADDGRVNSVKNSQWGYVWYSIHSKQMS